MFWICFQFKFNLKSFQNPKNVVITTLLGNPTPQSLKKSEVFSFLGNSAVKKFFPPSWCMILHVFDTQHFQISRQNLILFQKGNKVNNMIKWFSELNYSTPISWLHSVTSYTTFSCDDYSLTLPVAHYDSFTLLWVCIQPLGCKVAGVFQIMLFAAWSKCMKLQVTGGHELTLYFSHTEQNLWVLQLCQDVQGLSLWNIPVTSHWQH